MATDPPSAAAEALARLEYGYLPADQHVLGRPFYALGHHLTGVLDGAQLVATLQHLCAARAAALPDAPPAPAPQLRPSWTTGTDVSFQPPPA